MFQNPDTFNELSQKMQKNQSVILKQIEKVLKMQETLLQKEDDLFPIKLFLKENIASLKDEIQSLIKQENVEVIEKFKKLVKDIENRSTDYNKANETAIKNMHKDVIQVLNELKHNYVDAETCKMQIQNEKERATKNISKQLEVYQKESKASKENQHELQSTIQKLEDALRQSESEHDKIIAQHTEDIQHYKNINNTEKLNSVKVQEKLEQELQDKEKQYLTLKESQHELQSTMQKLEDALRQSESEHDKIIAQHTEDIQHYKNINNTEKLNSVKVQEKLEQELQDKEKQYLTLKESQHELQSTIQKLEDALRQSESEHDKIIAQHTEDIQHYKNINNTEKLNSVKVQEKLEQELQDKEKQYLTLKESQHELEDALRKFKTDHDKYIKEIEHYKNLSDTEKENTIKVQDTLA